MDCNSKVDKADSYNYYVKFQISRLLLIKISIITMSEQHR